MAFEFGRYTVAWLLGAAVAALAYIAAAALHPRATRSARWASVWGLSLAWQVATFYLLGAAGWFAPAPVVGLTLVAAGACTARWGKQAAARWRDDWEAAAAIGQRLGVWRLALAVSVLAPAVRLVRAAVSPPIAWDALTYHLPRAVEWIQAGQFVLLPGPDASAYYSYFPPYGDIPLAWAMLVPGGDGLLFVAGAWAWAGVWIGGFALARAAGAARGPAVAAAAVCASVPAVASFVGSNYVDNTATATLLVALVFAARTLGAWRLEDAAAAGVAMGLLAGTKSSAIPAIVTVIGVLSIAAAVRRRPAAWRALAVATTMTAVMAAPPALRAYRATGNPFYPITVSVGARTWLHGDAQLEEVMRFGEIDPRRVVDSLVSWRRAADHDFLGFGPGLVVVAAGAVVGALRRRRRSAALALLALVACAIVLPTFSASSRVLWSIWPATSPRLVVGAAAVLVVLAARSPGASLLWLVAIGSAVMSLPRGVSTAEWTAMRAIWPALGLLAVTAIALGWPLRGIPRLAALAINCLALGAATTLVQPVREDLRLVVYDEAARGAAFDLHVLGPGEAGAAPLWRQLADRPATRLAVSAAFFGAGHNWFRYPLYGRRLQHRVQYIPVSASGDLLSYRDPRFEALACEACWTQRLQEAGVELMIGLLPPPPEIGWARRHPDHLPRCRTLATPSSCECSPSSPCRGST